MKSFEPSSLPSGLYIIATPVGNLGDMTNRALGTLAAVDLIICEDTRVTGKLLHAFGIEAKMIVYNDHNADRQRGRVLDILGSGGKVALVSDAGMPLISDPGYKLVRDCLDLGLYVTSLPGANAPLTALQLSGLPSDKFSFLGFMPPKSEGRKKLMREWGGVPGTLLVFESAQRLADSLHDMIEIWGNRPAAVIREMTKMHEETRRGTLSGLLEYYRQEGAPKGEIVIVVGAALPAEYSDDILEKMLEKALVSMSLKQAASFLAEQTGEPRKRLYEMALRLKK